MTGPLAGRAAPAHRRHRARRARRRRSRRAGTPTGRRRRWPAPGGAGRRRRGRAVPRPRTAWRPRAGRRAGPRRPPWRGGRPARRRPSGWRYRASRSSPPTISTGASAPAASRCGRAACLDVQVTLARPPGRAARTAAPRPRRARGRRGRPAPAPTARAAARRGRRWRPDRTPDGHRRRAGRPERRPAAPRRRTNAAASCHGTVTRSAKPCAAGSYSSRIRSASTFVVISAAPAGREHSPDEVDGGGPVDRRCHAAAGPGDRGRTGQHQAGASPRGRRAGARPRPARRQCAARPPERGPRCAPCVRLYRTLLCDIESPRQRNRTSGSMSRFVTSS